MKKPRSPDRSPKPGSSRKAPQPARRSVKPRTALSKPELLRRAQDRLTKRDQVDTKTPFEDDVKLLIDELQSKQTDLKRQNEELREARSKMEAALDRYAELYDFSPAGHFTLSAKGDIIDTNLTGVKLLETERSGLVGQRFQLFVDSCDAPCDFDVFLSKIFAGGGKQTMKVVLNIPNRGAVTNSDPMPMHQKVVRFEGLRSLDRQYCRAAVIDISETEQAQKALRINSQLLETSQSIAKVGGWSLDLATYELFWTQETYRIHETSREEYTPILESAISFYPPSSIRELSAAVDAAISRGEGFNLELDFMTAKGNYRKVQSTCEVDIVDGKPVKLTGVIRDITASHQTKTKLKRSEAFTRATLNALVANICVLDENGVIVEVNETWTRFGSENGATSACGVGANYLDVCQKATGQGAAAAHELANAIRSVSDGRESGFYAEYPCHGPDEKRWFSVRLTRFRGTQAKWVVVAHVNITSRKLAEESLLESRQDLRALSSRVQNMREEESIRIARKVHDELGQQLTGLKMDLGMIEQELVNLEAARAEEIWARVVSLNSLLDETIGTVQDIATDLRPPLLDQIGLVAALRRELNQMESRSGLTCIYQGPEDEVPLIRDLATACFRIAQEALTNVLRHAEATTVEVELTAERNTLTMEIRDDGKGLGWEGEAPGQSLGLLGMEERAHRLGGALVVQNRSQGGTRVRVTFPLEGPLAGKVEA